jgi:hypothetical protein
VRIEVKVVGPLYREILRDLARPHSFAAERVGFVFGRIGSLASRGKVILLTRYHSIPDNQYIDDATVGARIGSEALIWATQAVYHGRSAREGIFHIHLHGHRGETSMSSVDSREIRRLMPGFQSVGANAAHGIIILSMDHGSSWVLLPTSKELVRADAVTVIGTPIGIFEPRIGN